MMVPECRPEIMSGQWHRLIEHRVFTQPGMNLLKYITSQAVAINEGIHTEDA
jgi:hypothetical protein